MAAMMLMIIHFNKAIIKIYYHQHYCSNFMAATFYSTTFLTQDIDGLTLFHNLAVLCGLAFAVTIYFLLIIPFNATYV